MGAEFNHNSKPLEMKQIFSFFIFSLIASIPQKVLSQPDGSSKALIKQASGEIRLHSFSATQKNDKVYLQWVIADNGAVERFEVERSIDGRKFTTGALVFGSEETGNEIYKFFEVTPRGRVMYRLKMFNKDLKTEYSNVLLLKL